VIVSRRTLLGMFLTVGSAALFAMSGPIAKTLYSIGWSPGAVVSTRLLAATILLAPFTLASLRGRWRELRSHWRYVVSYGVVSMAGMQALFFVAVQRLSVTVALLLAMTAPVMIVLWDWGRSRRRPAGATFVGIAVSAAGLLLVLDPRGAMLSVVGVIAALATAACVAIYFVVSADQSVGVPPIALIGLGMLVGAATIVVCNLVGVFPVRMVARPVDFAGTTMSWAVPFALLVAFTVGGYVFNIVGLRYIGATVGSFVSLVEVPFASLTAWLILAEAVTMSQLWGTALIVIGVVFVKWGDMRRERREAIVGTGWEATPVGTDA
jgi:drug/metabolite transporter (DMT)-like permease